MKKQSISKVAFIGLGKMGSVLAKKILEANFDLTIYNRTSSKMQPLILAGARGAQSIQQAVDQADVVVTCLFNDEAVLDVVAGKEGFLKMLKPGAIHISISTILPSTSKKLTKLHEENGSIYIAGNILGVPKVAERGESTTLAAGDPNALNACNSIFNAYSNKIIQMGSDAYKANAMKLSTNYLLATAIESIGEIYAYTEKNDIETEIVSSFFHSVFAHPAFKLYVEKIKEQSFDDVNFDLKTGAKDLDLVQEAFTKEHVTPDIANSIKNKFEAALAQGMGEKDWCAITEITRKKAGLKSKN
jgi:3-hydroxyisobutyrate dehydrogenase-like beta-hydroxyacid dehydrogenase